VRIQRIDDGASRLRNECSRNSGGHVEDVARTVGYHCGSDGFAIPLDHGLGDEPTSLDGESKVRAPCGNGGRRQRGDHGAGVVLKRIPIIIAARNEDDSRKTAQANCPNPLHEDSPSKPWQTAVPQPCRTGDEIRMHNHRGALTHARRPLRETDLPHPPTDHLCC